MPKCPTQQHVHDEIASRWLERLVLYNTLTHDVVHFLATVALTCMVHPRFVAPFACRMRVEPMALPGLHRMFEGYRVLFVSDLHVGRTRQSYLETMLRRAVDGLRPDIILLGGDLIDYQPEALPLLARVLPILEAADGVYAIFGNHDYHERSWRHVGPRAAQRVIHRRMRGLLEDRGIEILTNAHATIRRAEGVLQIVGIDEIWTGRADPQSAFAGVAPDQPTICLLHNSDGYECLQDQAWHWLLCGHSHGGQVVLPVLGALYIPQRNKQRIRGYYQFDDPRRGGAAKRMMYISTGIGYSHPLRLGVPPEVTLFELTAGEPCRPEGLPAQQAAEQIIAPASEG